MVFTIQFCKEFAKVGLKNAIGGLLGLAFARELTPVICAIVLTGRIGSSIAAELGTMQVTEQVDQLTVLGTDPVDYLVIPRVIACACPFPSSASSPSPNPSGRPFFSRIYATESRRTRIPTAPPSTSRASDIGIMTAKSIAFGAVIAVISCGWGTTTTGGAKGVGESTTRERRHQPHRHLHRRFRPLARLLPKVTPPSSIDRYNPPPVVSRET